MRPDTSGVTALRRTSTMGESKAVIRRPDEFQQFSTGAERNLRSQESIVSTYITFVNRTRETVTGDWINYEGNLVQYWTLGTGEEFQARTYVTHPWVIRDLKIKSCSGVANFERGKLCSDGINQIRGFANYQQTSTLYLHHHMCIDASLRKGSQQIIHGDICPVSGRVDSPTRREIRGTSVAGRARLPQAGHPRRRAGTRLLVPELPRSPFPHVLASPATYCGLRARNIAFELTRRVTQRGSRHHACELRKLVGLWGARLDKTAILCTSGVNSARDTG
ncbi:hypothetical protein C8R44DRAFT_930298 [Mycena epipterygia]|nr:hypothetical protein C8R44DRAFT_930298 [Mycena epipterygia]